MARYATYQCGSCEGRFRWLHHPSDEPPPEHCPLCGEATDGPEPVFNPEAPSIKGVAAAAGDQVYRAMEASSAARVEQMVEMGGGTAADYAHTKITDMKDNQREGDTAYKMPPNPVSDFMAQHPNVGGASHVAFAQEKAAQAHTGYMPHAGARTGSVVGAVHAQMVNRMRSLGQINK
jgi:hypothetical protein